MESEKQSRKGAQEIREAALPQVLREQRRDFNSALLPAVLQHPSGFLGRESHPREPEESPQHWSHVGQMLNMAGGPSGHPKPSAPSLHSDRWEPEPCRHSTQTIPAGHRGTTASRKQRPLKYLPLAPQS